MRLKKYEMRMLPLVVLTWLLVGCQSNSVKPTKHSPQLPGKPSLSTPLPTRELLESCTTEYSKLWQKKLMDTSVDVNGG